MRAWGLGQRPLRLMFAIPSPKRVLAMQARDSRVVTMFTAEEELARCHVAPLEYMAGGAILHSRDPLHFLCHAGAHSSGAGARGQARNPNRASPLQRKKNHPSPIPGRQPSLEKEQGRCMAIFVFFHVCVGGGECPAPPAVRRGASLRFRSVFF